MTFYGFDLQSFDALNVLAGRLAISVPQTRSQDGRIITREEEVYHDCYL